MKDLKGDQGKRDVLTLLVCKKRTTDRTDDTDQKFEVTVRLENSAFTAWFGPAFDCESEPMGFLRFIPVIRGSSFLCITADRTGNAYTRKINLTDSSGFVRKPPTRNADV